MKLDVKANHDPVNGFMCRVCQICYESREGFTSYGYTTDHTYLFTSKARKFNERVSLEACRLLKRKEKLLKSLSEENNKIKRSSSTSSMFDSRLSSLFAVGSLQRIEENAVPWQPNDEATHCPICFQAFNLFGLRRHHCRLCGRVICDFDAPEIDENGIKLRQCKECVATITRYMHKTSDSNLDSFSLQICKIYKELCKEIQFVDGTLPKFNGLLELFSSNCIVTDKLKNDYHSANILRKSLSDSFVRIDKLSKQIKLITIPEDASQRHKLVNSLIHSITLYLQNHMFTLRMMPILKNNKFIFNENDKVDDKPLESTPIVSSSPSVSFAQTFFSLFKTESQSISEDDKEKLSIFEFQKNQVQNYLQDAMKSRRLDDVQSLRLSLKEIENEINRIKNKN
ncbi:hypothetical protein O9G_003124 [Rozella allomycis CSF55]|uniref:FYVE-type domain-containing protein n=1 Tax=Rozella allomycis (strain CSF55) TaxID=988480 RepID=A0A075ASB2_ROZAC|nr:hypothetical protein O9G_003124 [Rozella allomycis CSF55]|eukprot:EPZ33128.1 hypothetical protein O9G_003124 [Rozella allomycis CSF55]